MGASIVLTNKTYPWLVIVLYFYTHIEVNDDEEADIVDDVNDSEDDENNGFCPVRNRLLDNSDQCVPHADRGQHDHGR